MRKRELIERIEKLESMVEFLCRDKEDDVVVSHFSEGCGDWGTKVEYFYANEVKCAKFFGMSCEIIENCRDWIVVMAEEYKLVLIRKYYQIEKATGIVQEIPKPAFVLEQELAEKGQSAKKEKVSGNKKRTKGSEQAK